MMGVLAVSLFDKEIDDYKTIKKTDRFLKKDFDRYLNFSGRHRLDLSSPLLDPTGVSSHGKNHEERKLVVGIAAGNAVDAINDTICDCENTGEAPYATILYLCYVLRYPNWKVQNRIGFRESQFYRLKKRALLEFAQRLEVWAERDHADLDSLVVWKEPESESQ